MALYDYLRSQKSHLSLIHLNINGLPAQRSVCFCEDYKTEWMSYLHLIFKCIVPKLQLTSYSTAGGREFMLQCIPCFDASSVESTKYKIYLIVSTYA